MKKKKDLLLDIDDVVCFPGFLPAINEFLGADYKIDDFTNYYIEEAVIPKEQFQEFNEFLHRRNLYEDAVLLPGAVETLKLAQELYTIYPTSSCIDPFNIEESGKLFKNKYDYLYTMLPFINPSQYIFTNSKHLLKADVQIDDRLSNLGDNVETKILFPSYHNKNITMEELNNKQVLRAGYDWREGWEKVGHILLEELPKTYSLKK